MLHTWPQDLHLHIHIHVLVACGGLDAQGHWRTPTRSPTFRFPVHAMSKVFRGKFLDALQRASTSGELAHDPANNQALRQDRLTALKRHDWVVSAFLKRVAGIDLASCPHCRIGRWLTIEVLPATRNAPQDLDRRCRGLGLSAAASIAAFDQLWRSVR